MSADERVDSGTPRHEACRAPRHHIQLDGNRTPRARTPPEGAAAPASLVAPLTLSPATDRAGQVLGHWLDWRPGAGGLGPGGQGATDDTAAALDDFMRARGLATLRGIGSPTTVVVPVHWATLAQHGERYLRVLRQGLDPDSALCLEVRAPQGIEPMSGLVRFSVQHRKPAHGHPGLTVALGLSAADLPMAPALANAMGARHVSLDSRAVAHLCSLQERCDAWPEPPTLNDLRRFALVTRADNEGQRSRALKLSLRWLRGEGVAAPVMPHPAH